jgi:hypothetical protein
MAGLEGSEYHVPTEIRSPDRPTVYPVTVLIELSIQTIVVYPNVTRSSVFCKKLSVIGYVNFCFRSF